MVYEIDLSLEKKGVPVRVPLSQYDNSIPQVRATIWSQGQHYTIPSGAMVFIAGTKQDKTGFMYEAAYSGYTVTFDITDQMTVFSGDVVVELIIQVGTERKGSANFVLEVERAALEEDIVISETDLPIIEELAKDVAEVQIAAEKAIHGALDSEAYAKGTRNGEDVSPDDEAYHNNSKYFSGISEDHSKDSEAYARGTRDGVDVGDADPTYHNNSRWYAQRSDARATDAEAYADGQRNGVDVTVSDPAYQNNAKYYRDQTQAMSNDSEAYARGTRGGTNVPTTDPTYHNNSKWYSEQAQNSATNAATSETNAKSYEDMSKSYAVGTGNVTRPADETDNSKYYSQVSAEKASEANTILQQIRDYSRLIIPSLYLDSDDGVLYVEQITDKTVEFAFDDDEATLYYKFVAA